MRFLRIAAGCAAAFVLAGVAHAQDINPCPFSFIPCGGGGVAGGNEYLIGTVFPALRVLFIGMALAHFFYHGFRLILEGGEENVSKESKTGYEQTIYACATVSIATYLVDAFGSSAQDTLINPEPLAYGLGNLIFYFKMVVAALLTMIITISAIRLIVVNSDEEKAKAGKRLLTAFLGVAAILLANTIVEGFQPGAGSAVLSDEARGVANFLLEIFGALAVFSFIAAGAFLVLSADESLTEKAKKTMFGSAVAIAVVLSSYVLVNYFLGL